MGRDRNNIGVLRLLLACLVIVGHAFEMVDGNRAREPLTAVFHTLSLGEVSVDAFFLLSGYLITQSMERAASTGDYLLRRALRIYPAFVVAFLLCVFVLGPMVGARPLAALPETVLRLVLLLAPPDYTGEFPGLHFSVGLDWSMWTIAYEFRCYLLVAALGAAGLLTRRRTLLAVAGAVLAASILATFPIGRSVMQALNHLPLIGLLVGAPASALRLTAVFMVGMCAYLFRDAVFARLDGRVAAACALVCAALLYRDPHFADAALVTFGAAALFWLAFKARLGAVQAINDRWDVSYGVYLYGWPIATYVRWLNPAISPWALIAVTLPLALVFGAASWWGLEKWAKDPRRLTRTAPSAPAVVSAR